MKIYLLHEQYKTEDLYNIYPYSKLETAIEHVSNEVGDTIEDTKQLYKEGKREFSNNLSSYRYIIEESELL